MTSFLYYGVIFSFLFCLIALLGLTLRTFSFGKKKVRAASRGDWKKGVVYAFGVGMMPWEKESARRHLVTYFSGFLYHFGIFAGLFYLFISLLDFSVPVLILKVIQIFLLGGLVCGLGLLVKRSVYNFMRSISCPDDFVANILADGFVFIALLDTFIVGIQAYFWGMAIILFLYIPVGKIRHCFFFFYSRILFGVFFGRRGVYPKDRKMSRV